VKAVKKLPPRSLQRAHFAFMRALAQGLDERASWDRYLRTEGEHADIRTVRKTIAWIRASSRRRMGWRISAKRSSSRRMSRRTGGQGAAATPDLAARPAHRPSDRRANEEALGLRVGAHVARPRAPLPLSSAIAPERDERLKAMQTSWRIV